MHLAGWFSLHWTAFPISLSLFLSLSRYVSVIKSLLLSLTLGTCRSHNVPCTLYLTSLFLSYGATYMSVPRYGKHLDVYTINNNFLVSSCTHFLVISDSPVINVWFPRIPLAMVKLVIWLIWWCQKRHTCSEHDSFLTRFMTFCASRHLPTLLLSCLTTLFPLSITNIWLL